VANSLPPPRSPQPQQRVQLNLQLSSKSNVSVILVIVVGNFNTTLARMRRRVLSELPELS
jgi:hypothetical protein